MKLHSSTFPSEKYSEQNSNSEHSDAQHRWVSRHALAWLLVAQGVSLLPLLFYLPLWLPFLWVFSLVWRVQVYRGAWSFPSSRIKFVLCALSVMGLIWSYAGSIGVEPLVAFLAVSFILKLLEARKQNDVLLIVNVGFIAIAAQFLFYQTMFIALYALANLIILLCAWNSIYRSNSISFKRQFSASTILLLQSIPLMLVLFVVLPRLGSLWHVPIPQGSGKAGFSDSMSPGDFTALSQSREVAFRVSFSEAPNQAPIPPQSEWYWRGLVFDSFDGRRWSALDKRLMLRSLTTSGVPNYWQLNAEQSAPQLTYDILMEPHNQRWLFTLMAPVWAESNYSKLFFAPDYLTKSAKIVTSRSSYRVRSNFNYQTAPETLRPNTVRATLNLPSTRNPRTLALAQEWVNEGLRGQELVDRALAMYQASFTYTLKPPALGRESVDEFLFETQRGFCEHFSSSFVVLMRAAGIPARVVVGYQGGEYNPIENYIIVRQSNAHAWAEIWLEGKGWIRVDPTAAVSPLRIEQGLEQSLADDERGLVGGYDSAFLNRLQLQLDALSYSWHQWVLGYDNEQQASLFKNFLGGTEAWRIGMFFIVIVASLLGGYFILLTWQGRKRFEFAEQQHYAQLLKMLKKQGFEPQPHETPSGFAQRVCKEKPAWEKPLNRVADLYNRISYGNQTHLMVEFQECVIAMKRQIRQQN